MASGFDRIAEGDDRQPATGTAKARIPGSDEGRAVLRDYLDASARLGEDDSPLLPPLKVLEQSGLFAYHPIIEQLGGYVLDDTGTSDHHILATSSPLMGSVLFLAHDGDSRFVFESGTTFLAAVREAHERGIDVADLHPDHAPLAKDQSALGAFVRSLLDRQGMNDVVICLLPSLNLEDIDLLRRLAQDEDFLVGEAVGRAIERRPSQALLSIAELCAAHRHPQVARAGERALRRIRQPG